MASLLQIDRVQYLIEQDKEETVPLARLYFCIYCMSVKSSDALEFEIDSHFCPQTLDGLPPGEAASKKNRSNNSWQCPFCFHSLSTKATNITVASPDEQSKPLQKKSYYQACSFCHWTSRSAGIQDKDTASGGWSEVENPHQSRIQELLEYYKSLSTKELAELDQKKSPKKKGHLSILQLQQKYGSASAFLGRKPATSLPSSISTLRTKEVNIPPSKTVGLDGVEKLPEDIYTTTVDFTQISSVEQRLDQPSIQPTEVSNLLPHKSTMLVRRSLRCKKCDHNIIKPEYNASSIKFKINLTAVQHVPEVRINKLSDLSPGKKTRITLSFLNATVHVMHLTLFSDVGKRRHRRYNTQIEFPASNLVLSKFDETAEYTASQDDASEVGQDDPNVIAFRSANKLGFYADVTPDVSLSRDKEMWTAFSFKYDHHGAVPVAQMLKSGEAEKKPNVVWLTQTVFINLGKVA